MTAPRWVAAPAGAVTLVALICLSAGEASPQESGSRTELTGPECEACEIVAVPVVTFGDAEGPGMLEADYHVVSLDRQGRYFVTGGPSPYFWVFDRTGNVTHRIGRSGEGPGEFSVITGIASGEADSVFVLDPIRLLASVYTPDLEFARSFRLSFSPEGPELLFGASFLINTPFRRGDLVGLPFHVLDRNGRMTRSFGSADGADLTVDRYVRDGRRLARSDTASFWAARTNQYLIERWTVDGRLLETLHRELPWFQVWWEYPADADTPPVPTMIAIEQVGDTLWVLTSVPGEGWRAGVEPDGRFYRVTDRDVYRNSVVEAIDLKRGVVIASQRMPLRFTDLLQGGLAVRNDTDQVGNPIVSIHRLEIRVPPR